MPVENLATILGPTVVGFGEFDTPANEYAKVEKVEKVNVVDDLLREEVAQVMAMLLRESPEYWQRMLNPQQPLMQGSTPGLFLPFACLHIAFVVFEELGSSMFGTVRGKCTNTPTTHTKKTPSKYFPSPRW